MKKSENKKNKWQKPEVNCLSIKNVTRAGMGPMSENYRPDGQLNMGTPS